MNQDNALQFEGREAIFSRHPHAAIAVLRSDHQAKRELQWLYLRLISTAELSEALELLVEPKQEACQRARYTIGESLIG